MYLFWNSSLFLSVLIVHAFLSSIPLCGQTTVCLAIHLQMGIRVASRVWPYKESCCAYSRTRLRMDLGSHLFRRWMAGSYFSCMFDFLRNCQIIFHSGFTFPPAVCMSPLSPSSPALTCLFYYSHPRGYKLVISRQLWFASFRVLTCHH